MASASACARHPQFIAWCRDSALDMQSYPQRRFVNAGGKRCCLKACSLVACLPCWLWSALLRILLCPCTCGSSLGGSRLTAESDACIQACCAGSDQRAAFVNARRVDGLAWVRASTDPEVKAASAAVIDAMLATMRSGALSLTHRYQLVDQVVNALGTLGYTVPPTVTPANVAEVAARALLQPLLDGMPPYCP